MKKLIALLLALVMVLSMAACAAETTTSDNADQTTTQPAQSETDDTQSSEPVQPTEDADTSEQTPDTNADAEPDNETVEYYMQKANEVQVTDTHVIFTDDGSGEELSIEKNPKNVAILYGSLICMWYEAGGTVPLAVSGKSASILYEEQIGRDITQDEGVKIVAESSSGTAWDVEAILAEQPDLIVCSVGMSGYATIAEPAAAVGIPVVGINYFNVQDYLKWFKVFCNLTGHPELWDEVAEKTANDIIDIVSAVPEVDHAPTAAIIAVSSDKLKAYTQNSQPSSMLNELGGINVFNPNNDETSASGEISLEDLYALDPDIILFSEQDRTGANRAQFEEMTADNPVWQELRAVKEGRVYILDMGLFFNKANKRYNEAYQTMAQFLYPDAEF